MGCTNEACAKNEISRGRSATLETQTREVSRAIRNVLSKYSWAGMDKLCKIYTGFWELLYLNCAYSEISMCPTMVDLLDTSLPSL
jgi:hypothetical protein